MKYIFAIIIVIITSVRCASFEPLLSKRENYTDNQLKTEGYYYILTKSDMGYGYKTKVYDCLMLFKNGIYYNVVHGGYNPNLSIDSILVNIDSEVKFQVKREKDNLNQRPNWGTFIIQDSLIKIERWVFSSGGGTYATQKVFGRILNDSTIDFYEQERDYPTQYGKNKKREKINNIYNFRKFSPKPDSTNKFIK
jgi:hypothetical protein